MVVMLRASWPASWSRRTRALAVCVLEIGDSGEMRKGVNIVLASGGITIRYEELVDLSDSKHEGH